MQSTRTLLALVLLAAALGSATAQSDARLRWRAGSAPLGLQPSTLPPPLPCGAYTFSCSGAALVPLYTSRNATRSLSMQVGPADARVMGSAPVNVSLIGKAGIASDLGVYGRVGTTVQRGVPRFGSGASGDGGVSYGVGLSWDLSRSASAALGWDSYDLRSAAGDGRELRTSLGLQWRY